MMIFASESGSHGIPPSEKNPALLHRRAGKGGTSGSSSLAVLSAVVLCCLFFFDQRLCSFSLSLLGAIWSNWQFQKLCRFYGFPLLRFYVSIFFKREWGFPRSVVGCSFFFYVLGFALKAFISR